MIPGTHSELPGNGLTELFTHMSHQRGRVALKPNFVHLPVNFLFAFEPSATPFLLCAVSQGCINQGLFHFDFLFGYFR